MGRITFFVALLFSVLIVVENGPHAAHRLPIAFASPEPGDYVAVGAYILVPLILLWLSWALLKRRAHSLISFFTAASAVFLTMDYFLPYPGPVKKAFFMMDEGRKIYGAGLESFGDEPFLTKQGNPIGIALSYTVSFPAGGKYLVGTRLSPVSRPLRPKDAGVDPSGSALEVLWEAGSTGPEEWLTVQPRTSVKRTKYATPQFIFYNRPTKDFCLFPGVDELLKDNPGPTKYLVELRVSGERTLLDQMATLHFETRTSYDVREFYRSAIQEHMPVCSPLGIR